MEKIIVSFLLISLSVAKIGQYKIDFTDTTSRTFSNSYSNVAQCSCDLKANICDIFCCCDSSCLSNNIDSWRQSQICTVTSSEITNYNYCSDTSVYGSNTYQSLNCIYFDNKNSIGSYFKNGSDINDNLIIHKMGQKMIENSKGFQKAAATIYLPGLPINYFKDNVVSSINFIPMPFGSSCKNSQLLLGQNKVFTCDKIIDDNSCNRFINLTGKFCQTANCSNNQQLTLNISNCPQNKTLQNFDIVVNLSKSGTNDYMISSIHITANQRQSNIQTIVKGSIKFNYLNFVSKSGSPGYKNNLPILLYNSSYHYVTNSLNIKDSSGNCLRSPTSTINFLSSYEISCQYDSSNLNNIFSASFISKYGGFSSQNTLANNNDVVKIIYSNRSNSNTPPKLTTLTILYSKAGSSLDYQNYILAGSVSYTEFQNQQILNNIPTVPSTFKVKWIYVDPDTVSRPIVNNFYNYFSKLWNPIQNTYNRLLFQYYLIGAFSLLSLVVLC